MCDEQTRSCRTFFCFGSRSERFYDDVDEMRAFMSMFMELVGMFGSDIPSMPNGCGPGCKGGHVQMPPGERASELASEHGRPKQFASDKLPLFIQCAFACLFSASRKRTATRSAVLLLFGSFEVGLFREFINTSAG